MTFEHYIGIDNGLSGAAVVLNKEGEVVDKFLLPVEKTNEGNQIDVLALAQKVQAVDLPYAMVERASKHSNGKLALCSTWQSYGQIKAALNMSLIPFDTVPPQSWQRKFWTKKEYSKDEYNTKVAALGCALRIWPDETWLPNSRCRKPNHNLIDAALIAEFARRLKT